MAMEDVRDKIKANFSDWTEDQFDSLKAFILGDFITVDEMNAWFIKDGVDATPAQPDTTVPANIRSLDAIPNMLSKFSLTRLISMINNQIAGISTAVDGFTERINRVMGQDATADSEAWATISSVYANVLQYLAQNVDDQQGGRTAIYLYINGKSYPKNSIIIDPSNGYIYKVLANNYTASVDITADASANKVILVIGERKDGLTPFIGANENWWIGDTDTGIPARGQNGITPHVDNVTGTWFVGALDTGVKAQGYTPYVDISTGNWFINGVNTGVHAQGDKGEKGDSGIDLSDATIVADQAALADIASTLNEMNTGAAYYDNETGTIYVWNGTAFGNGIQVRGAKGDQGEQGPIGPPSNLDYTPGEWKPDTAYTKFQVVTYMAPGYENSYVALGDVPANTPPTAPTSSDGIWAMLVMRGPAGPAGTTPSISFRGTWIVGGIDTGIAATSVLQPDSFISIADQTLYPLTYEPQQVLYVMTQESGGDWQFITFNDVIITVQDSLFYLEITPALPTNTHVEIMYLAAQAGINPPFVTQIQLQALQVILQTQLDQKLALSGGTMTGPLILRGDATNDLEPISKRQLEDILEEYSPEGGLDFSQFDEDKFMQDPANNNKITIKPGSITEEDVDLSALEVAAPFPDYDKMYNIIPKTSTTSVVSMSNAKVLYEYTATQDGYGLVWIYYTTIADNVCDNEILVNGVIVDTFNVITQNPYYTMTEGTRLIPIKVGDKLSVQVRTDISRPLDYSLDFIPITYRGPNGPVLPNWVIGVPDYTKVKIVFNGAATDPISGGDGSLKSLGTWTADDYGYVSGNAALGGVNLLSAEPYRFYVRLSINGSSSGLGVIGSRSPMNGATYAGDGPYLVKPGDIVELQGQVDKPGATFIYRTITFIPVDLVDTSAEEITNVSNILPVPDYTKTEAVAVVASGIPIPVGAMITLATWTSDRYGSVVGIVDFSTDDVNEAVYCVLYINDAPVVNYPSSISAISEARPMSTAYLVKPGDKIRLDAYSTVETTTENNGGIWFTPVTMTDVNVQYMIPTPDYSQVELLIGSGNSFFPKGTSQTEYIGTTYTVESDGFISLGVGYAAATTANRAINLYINGNLFRSARDEAGLRLLLEIDSISVKAGDQLYLSVVATSSTNPFDATILTSGLTTFLRFYPAIFTPTGVPPKITPDMIDDVNDLPYVPLVDGGTFEVAGEDFAQWCIDNLNNRHFKSSVSITLTSPCTDNVSIINISGNNSLTIESEYQVANNLTIRNSKLYPTISSTYDGVIANDISFYYCDTGLVRGCPNGTISRVVSNGSSGIWIDNCKRIDEVMIAAGGDCSFISPLEVGNVSISSAILYIRGTVVINGTVTTSYSGQIVDSRSGNPLDTFLRKRPLVNADIDEDAQIDQTKIKNLVSDISNRVLIAPGGTYTLTGDEFITRVLGAGGKRYSGSITVTLTSPVTQPIFIDNLFGKGTFTINTAYQMATTLNIRQCEMHVIINSTAVTPFTELYIADSSVNITSTTLVPLTKFDIRGDSRVVVENLTMTADYTAISSINTRVNLSKNVSFINYRQDGPVVLINDYTGTTNFIGKGDVSDQTASHSKDTFIRQGSTSAFGMQKIVRELQTLYNPPNEHVLFELPGFDPATGFTTSVVTAICKLYVTSSSIGSYSKFTLNFRLAPGSSRIYYNCDWSYNDSSMIQLDIIQALDDSKYYLCLSPKSSTNQIVVLDGYIMEGTLVDKRYTGTSDPTPQYTLIKRFDPLYVDNSVSAATV